jgi:HEAT repeat protein
LHLSVVMAVFACAFLVGLVLPVIAQDESKSEKIQQLFKEGRDLFYEGKIQAAIEKFNEVLSLKPTWKDAMQLRDEATWAVFVDIMRSDPELRYILIRILAALEEAPKIKEPSKTVITKALDDLRSNDVRTKFLAVNEVVTHIGQYVIPYCVRYLADRQDDDYRVEVIAMLCRMRRDATLPVICILDSSDSFLRQNSCGILANLADLRALGALKDRYEDPNEDEHVREAAKEALENLLVTFNEMRRAEGGAELKSINELGPAKSLYWGLALKYYYDDIAFVTNSYEDWLYWYWYEDEQDIDKKLKFHKVMRIEYNERLAEENCFRALNLDKDYADGWSLLLRVYYQELNEVQSALEMALELRAKGEVSEDTANAFAKAREINEKCHTICYAGGEVLLLKALAEALAERNSLVAVSCIEALRDMKVGAERLPLLISPQPVSSERTSTLPPPPPPDPTKAVGYPLVNALDFPDKRVRYAAAEALVFINPTEQFFGAEKVIPTLQDAVTESAVRVVLIIASDQIVANRIASRVASIGCMPVVEKKGRDGLNRARMFPPQDAIVVSTELPDMKAFEIIDALRDDMRTKEVPIIVMTPEPRLREVQRLYADRADSIITENEEEVSLRDKLHSLFELPKARIDAPSRAREMARRAAIALANVDLSNKNFDVYKAIPSLIEVLKRGSTAPGETRRLDWDPVRIPAMQALGRMGDNASSALQILAEIFANKDNKVPVRAAAADAIGDIVKPTENMPTSCREALAEGLNDPALEVQKAAAKALGKADLKGGDRFGIFKAQRVHKNQP